MVFSSSFFLCVGPIFETEFLFCAAKGYFFPGKDYVLIVDFNIILYYFCYVFLDSVQGLILRESFSLLPENAFHFRPREIILM